jgi:hypothetical protein
LSSGNTDDESITSDNHTPGPGRRQNTPRTAQPKAQMVTQYDSQKETKKVFEMMMMLMMIFIIMGYPSKRLNSALC